MLLRLRHARPLTAVVAILMLTFAGVSALVIGAITRLWQRDRTKLQALGVALAAQIKAAVAAREAMVVRDKRERRLRALGQVSAGVAHEFNNILQAVSGALDLIARRAGGTAELAAVLRNVDVARTAVERGAVITRRLTAFAKRAPLHPVQLDAAVILTALLHSIGVLLGPHVALSLAVPAGLPTLLADRADLEAALTNLVANARDAMPDGGALVITAAVQEIDIKGHPRATLGSGRYVTIAVTDTGVGMDADILKRATEPFFTTKEVGYGTGLGLSMAKGFAEQSGGNLVIDSVPGEGTTVTLWLPAGGLEHA